MPATCPCDPCACSPCTCGCGPDCRCGESCGCNTPLQAEAAAD